MNAMDRELAKLSVEPLRQALHGALIREGLSAEDRSLLEEIDAKASQLAERYRTLDLSLVGMHFAAELRSLQQQAHSIVAKYVDP